MRSSTVPWMTGVAGLAAVVLFGAPVLAATSRLPSSEFIAPGGAPDPTHGTWSSLNVKPSSISIPPAASLLDFAFALDTRRHRFVGLDGLRGVVWSMTPGGDEPEWRSLQATGGPPPARRDFSAAFDAAGDRLLVFGGELIDSNGALTNEVWSLRFSPSPEWSRLTPSGPDAPEPRGRAAAVYDVASNRMIMYGGWTRPYRLPPDVWSLSLDGAPTWSRLVPTGGPPPGRVGHIAAYDEVRRRLIVYGGYQGRDWGRDVWELRLGPVPEWREIIPIGEGLLAYGPGVYDPVGNQLVVLYGSNDFGPTWALDLDAPSSWTPLQAEGMTPWYRELTILVMDPASRRAFRIGGWDGISFGSPFEQEVWELRLDEPPRWRPAGLRPKTRYGHAGIYDRGGDRLLVAGGRTTLIDLYFYDIVKYDGALWELTFPDDATAAWNPVSPQGFFPYEGHRLVYDPRFGGAVPIEGYTLYKPLCHPYDPYLPQYIGPLSVGEHSAILDRAHDRVIMYGGERIQYLRCDHTAQTSRTVFDRLTEIRLGPGGSARPLAASGDSPGPRAGHLAVHDEDRERMILISGLDLWSLRLREPLEWARIVPEGSPSPQASPVRTIYDPVRERLIAFVPRAAVEVWGLSLTGPPIWTRLMPGGVPPLADAFAVTGYDSKRDRIAVQGSGSEPIWVLTFGEPLTRVEIVVNPGGKGSGLPPDSRGVTRVAVLGAAGFDVTRVDPESVVLSGARATTVGHGRVLTTARDVNRDGIGDLVFYFSTKEIQFGDARLRLDGRISGGGWIRGYAEVTSVRGDDEARRAESGTVAPGAVPAAFALHANEPNPFRGSTRFLFDLPSPARVRLEVFDLQGRLVRVVADADMPAGRHAIAWDPGAGGSSVTVGLYVYRLRAGGFAAARKLVVLP